jgi:prefoldin subunit 5
MSASDAELVQLEREGIHVTKQFTTEEFAVPVVRFHFTSKLEQPVSVRLLDSIPTEFDLDGNDPGFHPDFEGDYWELLEGNRVRFERVIKPGEEVDTLYGVPGPTAEDSYLFETTPTMYVNAVDGDEVDLPQGDGVVEDEIDLDDAGGGDEHDEMDADDSEANVEGAKEDSETESDHEADPESVAEEEEHESEDGDVDEESTDVVVEGSVAAALLAELENGELSEDSRAALVDALGGANEAPRLAVQLDHLQGRVAELDSYIDALGGFIDEEGTAQTIIEEYKSEVAALREQVGGISAGLDEDVAANADEIEQLSGELDALNEKLDSLVSVESRVDELEGLSERVDQLGELEARVAELDGTDERLSELEGLSEQVDSLSAQVEEMGDLTEVSEQLEQVDSQLDDVDARLEQVEESMVDADRLAALEDRVEEMGDGLEDVTSGMNILRQAFGGAMDPDKDEDEGDSTE